MGGHDDLDSLGSPTSEECERNLLTNQDLKRKKFLKPFAHQVGGHVGLLYWNSDTICKPYAVREHEFYSRISSNFSHFLPKYCGVVEVRFVEDVSGYLLLVAKSSTTAVVSDGKRSRQSSDAAAASSSAAHPPASPPLPLDSKLPTPQKKRKFETSKHRFRLKRSGSLELESVEGRSELFWDLSSDTYAAHNPWAIKCQTSHLAKLRKIPKKKHRFVLLENLVGGYALPCIVDLKMGTQQHGDHTAPEKKAHQMKKCEKSTSAKLGVRVVGMQVWNDTTGVYNCMNKYKGRELNEEGLKEKLRLFLKPFSNRPARTDLCRQFVTRINTLYKLVSESDGYRFYSSSLLMMYDGATTSQQNGEEHEEAPADIRMIDFEHSTFPGFLKDPPHVGVDHGYLLGLRTLAAIIAEIAADG